MAPRSTLQEVLLPLVLAGTVLLSMGQAPASPPPQSSPTPNPGRIAEMQHHFLQVSVVHEAVARGDLEAVRHPARQLSIIRPPEALTLTGGPFIQAIRQAGTRAASASSVASAAAMAVMLVQCGECHRAAAVRPAPRAVLLPDVGGLVGHMLEHQRAADDMLRGLIGPSDLAWTQGIERLNAAPLRTGELPRDPKLTREVVRAETAVHAVAADAARAETPAARATAYARLLTNCAECHSLHRPIWGPRSAGRPGN